MSRRGKKFCLDPGFYLDDCRFGPNYGAWRHAAENSFYMGVHWVLVRLCPRMHQNSVCLHLLNSTKQPEYSLFCKQKNHDVYKRR